MSIEKEPSVLDYARYYGLTRNHLEVNPLGILPQPENHSLSSDDDSIWQHLRTRAASPPPERLQAVKEASGLLAVTNPKQLEGFEFEGIDPFPRHRVSNLKHELPLLRTDHEVDMLSFVHRVDPNLADEFIPFEKVDCEQDEGFGWPSSYNGLPEIVFQRAQQEKLELPKDVFACLRVVLDARAGDEEPTWEFEQPTYFRSSITDPITPPLLPRSPSPIPYEPSSETGQLDLLSDQPSPTRQQVEALDEALIEKDSLVLLKSQIEPGDDGPEAAASNLTSVGGIYSPLKEISSTPSPRLWERSRKQDLKVDGPLTPPASDRPPPWDKKKVSFSEALHGIIPHLPPPMPEPERISDEDIEMLFAEHFEPTAARAERAIEQEQLKEADTTSRVPVPIMDFAKPTPPWHIAPSGTLDEWKRIVLSDLKEAYLDFPPWLQEGQSKKALSWVPFPMSKGRFELQETIEDDGSLAALVTAPEPLDPEILSWKPPGLRIFDKTHSSDEEELERGVFSPAGDVHSLVKERILEMQDGEERGNAPGCAQNLKDIKEQLANGPELRREELHSEEHQAEQSTGGYSAPMPGFSAINALDQFLSIRKGEIGRNNKLAKIHASTPTPHALLDTSEPRKPADINVAEQSTLPVPRPKITIPNKQCYYVASTGFLSNRRLAHQIKDLYPSAEMIERDFTIYALHSPHAEKNVHTARTGPEAPLDEADLILSPSTGLIITSLQKIKQQSLPGQATCSPIRERIQRTAARYERLIVLVSINSASSTDGASIRSHLEESDCEAIVSLTAFLNHLQGLSENDLILVDGGTTVLATWIVSLMVRYSSEVAITLLQDETQWEVFLRQAGMNAFAAQVVIAKLKAMQGSDGRPLGLRDLTLMDAEERYRRFEGLLCGRGLLERVGRVLDACW